MNSTVRSHAIVTLSVGDSFHAFEKAHQVFQAYATQLGVDFVVIRDLKFDYCPNWFRKRRVRFHIEKFQLYELFESYERILFLDSDILIRPDCPNLFDVVPESHFGAVYDDKSDGAWKRKEELIRMERRLAKLPNSEPRYFNSGVMVASRCHQDIFAFNKREIFRGRWPEQTLINYRLLKGEVPFYALDDGFNYHPGCDSNWNDPKIRLQKHIIHYAGPEGKLAFEKDWGFIAKAWGIGE